MQSHLKTIHENIKEFSCQICSKSFSTRYKLNRHKTSHSNVKNFACECGKTFKSRDPFLKHQRIHETGNETFFCSICFLEFKYRSGFNYHNQMKHHKRPPPTKITQKNASKDSEHTCEECLKVLPNKYSYNRHKSVHAPRSFACEQCGVKFKAPYDLQKHQKVHETLYFRCRACPRFFKEQKVLDVHMSHHSKKKLEKIQKEDEKKLAEIQKENEQKLAAENAELLEILDIIEENGLGPLEMTAEEQNKIIIESIEVSFRKFILNISK